jgi:hypothetical protein
MSRIKKPEVLQLQDGDVIIRRARNGWIGWCVEEDDLGKLHAAAYVRHVDENAPLEENREAEVFAGILWDVGLDDIFRSKHRGGLEFKYHKKGRG